MELQKRIFEIARQKLPPKQKLSDIVSELLDVSTDSAYRRIRGETELTTGELQKITKHFDIRIDYSQGHHPYEIPFQYLSFDIVKDFGSYYNYIVQFVKSTETMAKFRDNEMYFTAEDIPIFHLMPFPELIFFKLYAWNQTLSNLSITYDQFVADIKEKDKLLDCYQKIMNNYRHINSTEIWTYNTLDPILRLLDYYNDLGSFENKEMPGLICCQLQQMIDTLIKWTELKMKGGVDYGDFNLYLSPVYTENSFLVYKYNGITLTTIKLFTINSITTTDKTFCSETVKWIQNTISKSTYLSGASARERIRFFHQLKNKINNLADKFEIQQRGE
jgi:hypothetical protein